MSWLSGGLSSLTGQLSNLTKDILTEGTEEVSDQVTELRVAQEKIKELDTINVSQKLEIDRLKGLVHDWEEKAEGSELQINKISTEYRRLLQEKDSEIKTLKQTVQELQSSATFIGQHSEPSVLRLDSDSGFQSVSYGGDEHDFTDNISLQQDVNRLRTDVQRLQAECKHWQGLAQSSNKTAKLEPVQPQHDSSDLLKKIQALQDELASERDMRQFELASFQDAQAHKLTQMRKKHKEEIAELKLKIKELDWNDDGWDSMPNADEANLKQMISALQGEVTSLKEEKEEYLQQITSLAGDVETLNSELAVKQAQTLHLENQLKVAKAEISMLKESTQEVGQQLFDTKNRLLDQLDANHKRDLESCVENLEVEHQSVKMQTVFLVEEMGNPDQQNLTAGIMDSLEKENLLLRERNVGLQEQVALLERALQNANQERMGLVGAGNSGVYKDDLDLSSSDSISLTSDLSDRSKRNFELNDQVTSLKAQISNYEREIQQFEMLHSDWLNEKETLTGVLEELRSQLKEREHSLNVVEAQKGLLAVEKHENANIALPDLLDSPSKESSRSGSLYTTGMTEEDITQEVIELDRKVGLLTDANSELERERDSLLESQARLKQEITDLYKQLNAQKSSPKHETSENETSELNQHLKEKEQELQALMSEKEDLERNLAEVPVLRDQLETLQLTVKMNENKQLEIEALGIELEELKRKLRGKNEEIVNLSLEKEEMMQSLEELDKQNQEAMNHLIQIKDKLTMSNEELKTKLNAVEAEKQVLKADLEKAQSMQLLNQVVDSTSSNELNHEIAELKDEISMLKQHIEQLDRFKSKIELENKTKDEEIKGMKEKLISSAESLNNLHMDKQELNDKIKQLKEDMKKQSDKLKKLREENDALQQTTIGMPSESDMHHNQAQEISKMEEENSQLKSELEALLIQLKEASVELAHVRKEKNSGNEELTALRNSVNEKDESITELRNELELVRGENTAIQTQNENLAEDCRRLGEECARKHEECESFSRQLHAIESELQTVKKEFDIKEKDNNNLCIKIEASTKEAGDLRKNLNEKEQENYTVKKELAEVKYMLQDVTDKLHTRCEECNKFMVKVEEYEQKINELSQEQTSQYDAQLLSATGELVLVKEELESRTIELQRRDEELCLKEEENLIFKTVVENLKLEITHYVCEVESMTKQLNEKEILSIDLQASVKELKENYDSQVKQNEKLQSDLEALVQKHASQVEHFESYINEIMGTKESSKSTLQIEYDEILDKFHKKELEVTELKADLCFHLQECQTETSNATAEVEQLRQSCGDYSKEISVLKETLIQLNIHNKDLSDTLEKNNMLEEELAKANEKLETLEKEAKALQTALEESKLMHKSVLYSHENEKMNLNTIIEEMKVELGSEKLKEKSETSKNYELMKELDTLKLKIKKFEDEIKTRTEAIQEKDKKIEHLNVSDNENYEAVERLKEVCVQKDHQLSELREKLHEAVSFMQRAQGDGACDKEVLQERMETVSQIPLEGSHSICTEVDEDRLQHAKDVIAEIETLKGQLDKKDSVINELQKNNASLLKILDSKSKHTGDNSHTEFLRMENELKGLKMEKEQMMDVMNEKSRESSNLKSEVQRLMSIAAAQKSALEKLQKDNQDLSQKTADKAGAHIDDMQKEVVQNLSRIIRDKELEVESLTQKNETLLSVLQDSSNEGGQINSLMKDKDELSKQLIVLQGEREQMITYLNQKHQESVAYHAEVQRVTSLMKSEGEKMERLRHDYESMLPQFEDNKRTLVKAQNEMLNMKQRYQELEVKHGQLVHQDSCETIDKSMYDAKVNEIGKLQERFNEIIANIKEKEAKIQNLHQKLNDSEQALRTAENERGSYKKQVDGFNFQLHGLHVEQSELKAEITQLRQHKETLSTECQTLKDLNQRLTLQAGDRDFEIQSLQKNVASLSAIVNQQQGQQGQLQHVVEENEATKTKIRQLTHERHQAMVATQQQREETVLLQREMHALKDREAKLNRELSRLREHLLQIEDGYTKEALAAECREKELRTRLAKAEERALTSSSAVETANQQALHQFDSLQQQLQFVSSQRDQAFLQISSLQEQNDLLSSSITNLQIVLEQFQQEKERLVAEETAQYKSQVTSLTEQLKKAQSDLKYTKDQLDEASDGLEAAARLSEQLDRKEEAIDALREEVQIRESALKTLEEELRHLKSTNDDKVDKLVIKNLFLGYFTTPQNQRHDVLRMIGGVLLFTAEDFEKIEDVNKSGWVPGFLKFGGGPQKHASPPSTPARRSTISTPGTRPADTSFSQMFVKFLERESSPPPPAVRMPAEEMVRDVQQKQKDQHKPPYNPFTAPRHTADANPSSMTQTTSTYNPFTTTRPTSSAGQSTNQMSSQNSHLLMGSVGSVPQTIPTFVATSERSRSPTGSGRNTPSAYTTSSAILKDVLNR
ncbi:thyroid receptor-interacting protein 11-like isoform X3 [Dreissena polymorpha]|uniref:thyroid receptor-interacting protein 11-like isoform X3 n=1 Tax=Dreissena polymorpha TaxID=45954 RepID=UPI002264376C|nr:thyroid receptor-interacting protein 11-like isoform X3 [Dreissena polymorpha]